MDGVEINGEGVDSARVVADLRARAAERPPLETQVRELDLPAPLPTDRHAQLAAWLDRARRVATRLSVDPQVGWHTPVLGPLWNVLRRALYRDLRLYADAVTSKQMVYNEALVRILDLLVERVAALEAISVAHDEQLTARLASLEARLAAVEAGLAKRPATRRTKHPAQDAEPSA